MYRGSVYQCLLFKEHNNPAIMNVFALHVNFYVVSRSQNFRLMAECLKSTAAFIGQGPPTGPFDRHVKQFVSFIVMLRGVEMSPHQQTGV